MANDIVLPHIGKRAICAVAHKPFPLNNSWFCHLLPLLLRDPDSDSWECVSPDEFHDNRMIWCRLLGDWNESVPGELVSIRIEQALGYEYGKSRYQATHLQPISDQSFFELHELKVTDEDFINERSLSIPFVSFEPFYLSNGQEVFGPLRCETADDGLNVCNSSFGDRVVRVYDKGDFLCGQKVFNLTFSYSENTFPPGDHRTHEQKILRKVCVGNVPEKTVSRRIHVESDKDFVHRLNESLAVMKNNPKFRTFIEAKLSKTVFPSFVTSDEKKRYLSIVKALGEKFAAEHEIGNELLARLTNNDSVKQKIETAVQAKVDTQVAERTTERCKQIELQLKQKNRELSDLGGLVQAKEQQIAELKEEIEYLDALKDEAAEKASVQWLPILELLESGREKLIQEYVAIEPLIRRLNRPSEVPVVASTLRADKIVDHFVPTPLHESEAISNDLEFAQRRLYPMLLEHGIGCEKDRAEKLHLAALGCRFVLVPDELWGAVYAEACGGQFLIENVQPDWYSLSRAASPLLIKYWKAAIEHRDSLFFLMFEGINRCPVSSWVRPWSNVAAGLTRQVVLHDEVLPWPDNIRIFLSMDKSAVKFETDPLFFYACGTFCPAGTNFDHTGQVETPVSGHLPASRFERSAGEPVVSSLEQLPEDYDPNWRRAATKDTRRIKTLIEQFMSLNNPEIAKRIRIDWPMTYATMTGKK